MARHSYQNAAHSASYQDYSTRDYGSWSQADAGWRPAGYDYPPADGSTARYARDAYRGGGYPGRRRRRAGRVVKWILGILVAIVLICVIAVFAYASAFDSRTHANISTPDTLPAALTPALDENTRPYYVLLLGSDWRENSGTSDKPEMSGDNQRSDVIILARLDPAKAQVTLLSIPRDTRWEHDGTTYKINEAYNIGGAALETEAVSQLVGVPISHTVEMHFSGLEALVDALGGVKVDVPKTIEYKDALTGEKVTVEKGEQLLNGQEAQIFARVRKSYDTDNQDETRQGNVRTLVLAIVKTMSEKSPLEYPELGLKVADCLGTDMSFFDIAGIAYHFVLSGDMTLYSGTGPAAGAIDDNAGGLWLCYPNPDGWKAVMDVVDSGGDPSEVDGDSYLPEQQPAAEEAASAGTEVAGGYDEYGNYTGYGLYDAYGNYVGDASGADAGYYEGAAEDYAGDGYSY